MQLRAAKGGRESQSGRKRGGERKNTDRVHERELRRRRLKKHQIGLLLSSDAEMDIRTFTLNFEGAQHGQCKKHPLPSHHALSGSGPISCCSFSTQLMGIYYSTQGARQRLALLYILLKQKTPVVQL
mmetsp:Transcript_28000/g.54856  ORF Transcript_28000/g.54856 Transcript_28000/m.54856 type:complete len:127 (+) Transcript_28000:226-606(+)